MLESIVKKAFKRLRLKISDEEVARVLPTIVRDHGNSSVATQGITYDKLWRGEFNLPPLKKGDIVVFGAIGAGDPTIAVFPYMVSGLENFVLAA